MNVSPTQIDTSHLVDPELAPALDWGVSVDFAIETLPEMRERTPTIFRSLGGEAPAPRVETVAPGLQVRIHSPLEGGGPRPAIFHIHGGGFVSGTAEMCDGLNWRCAQDHGAVVVSVDFRLAPETPFPGGLEDCFAGLLWLFANSADMGVDPSRIVLLGESSGAGMAAALALLVRDRGGQQPAGQVLTYPMLDHRTGGSNDPYANPYGGQYIWTRGTNCFCWDALSGGIAIDPEQLGYFSPARARELGGLPPAFVGVGSLDLFIDEDLDYAARLARAGVPVELHVYSGCFHGFDYVPTAAVARRYANELSVALRRMLKTS